MGSTIYRPGHAKATSVTIQASLDEGGWALTVVRHAPHESFGHIDQRMRYAGLSDTELIDVVDVELSQALGIV